MFSSPFSPFFAHLSFTSPTFHSTRIPSPFYSLIQFPSNRDANTLLNFPTPRISSPTLTYPSPAPSRGHNHIFPLQTYKLLYPLFPPLSSPKLPKPPPLSISKPNNRHAVFSHLCSYHICACASWIRGWGGDNGCMGELEMEVWVVGEVVVCGGVRSWTL